MNKDKVECKVVSSDTDVCEDVGSETKHINDDFECPRHRDGAFEINKLFDRRHGNYQIIEDDGGRVSFRKQTLGLNKDHDYFRVNSTDYCVSRLLLSQAFFYTSKPFKKQILSLNIL